MNTMKYAWLLLFAASAATACKKDEDAPSMPEPVNENEVITTMRITFDDQGGGPDKVWQFRDADGDGGSPAVITADTLMPNAAYHASLLLLNESVSPVDTSSNEVLDENTLHQFFYQVSGVNVSFAYADTDDHGQPVGLATTATTTTPSNGTVRVTLRHEPDKSGANVAAGDITNAGGSTDIEVTFPAVVH
jgi:hypothetical protein